MTYHHTVEQQMVKEQRREQVAALYLSARTQTEIANELKLSRSTVTQDLKAVRLQWQKNALRSMDEVKAKELASIDRLEREYWDSWQASKKQREITSSEQSTGRNARTRASIRTEARDGDPRYLEGVRWCIDKRCELLGLNAAIRQMNIHVYAMPDRLRELLVARDIQPDELWKTMEDILTGGELAQPFPGPSLLLEDGNVIEG